MKVLKKVPITINRYLTFGLDLNIRIQTKEWIQSFHYNSILTTIFLTDPSPIQGA